MGLFSNVDPKRAPNVQQTEYLINGEILNWAGPSISVLSPICVEDPSSAGGVRQLVIGSYPMMTAEVAMQALKAAVGAYNNGLGLWPTMSVEDRIRFVLKFVEQMKTKRLQIIKLLMWEIGKSYADSAKEFDRTIEYINETIAALKSIDRDSAKFVQEAGITAQIRRAPLGVVLCMAPANYPLNESFTVLLPALLMGNTVIFKPPKMGVLLHQPLLECFKVFPKGVINTIYGDGATVTGPIMSSGQIDVLAFIGTSKVADILRKQHPSPHRLKCILGLESKNPGIILNDCDLDLTVKECVQGTLSFNGQRCTALKMLFVHKDVYPAFLTKFIEAIKNMDVGMPWENEGHVALTPVYEIGKKDYLHGLVEDAVKLGAEVALGDKWEGTFYSPTILTGVTDQMRIYREEQFGPIIPIMTFDDSCLEMPINYVIKSSYGQQVSVFGTSEEKMAYYIDSLVNQVCRVNLNCQCQRGPDSFPFTGRKDSAEGTLSITDALKVFSIRTLVAAKVCPVNSELIKNITAKQKSNFLSARLIF
jgi:glyceraldehyde-3-phosphate dehydrogenase (NADP+)